MFMSDTIDNALASLAVHDLNVSAIWFEKLIGRPSSSPMPEVKEWSFVDRKNSEPRRLRLA
jgi:hypothetical protein